MNPLIASILNNPSAHQVNRAEKMSRSIDAMVDNMIDKERQSIEARRNTVDTVKDSTHYGYGKGHGRGLGD